MGKVLPSQRLLKQFEERLVFGDMNLSEIVRSGAQMMLQYALEREVTEALGRGYYEYAGSGAKGALNIGLIDYLEICSNARSNKKISRLVSRGRSCALPSTVPEGGLNEGAYIRD